MIRVKASRSEDRLAYDALSHRIQSLALLYDELSGSGIATTRDDEVPAGAYVSRICASLAALEGRGGERMNVECDPVHLPIDTAARLGLVTTEFLTNAFDHAFPDGCEGTVRVRFHALSRGGVRLTVEDDGVGFEGPTNWPSPDRDTSAMQPGFGGSLVHSLCASVGAEAHVRSGRAGTTARVDIPAEATA